MRIVFDEEELKGNYQFKDMSVKLVPEKGRISLDFEVLDIDKASNFLASLLYDMHNEANLIENGGVEIKSFGYQIPSDYIAEEIEYTHDD
ncbi:MAG: hypothetical protein PHC62_00840 [Candidatus Izemoplasmatales bacterium]|nr:hypothetical protein [Candidatus Izemoplasmatales bacterium]